MFYIERQIANDWVIVSGPWACEQTANIHAKDYCDGRQVRVVTNTGAVVNIL